MRYAVIDVDQQVHIRDGDWKPELGPEGPDQVHLHPGTGMAAFVNGCAFCLPDQYPRNVLGALVAVLLGAEPRPLAGPVVLTGWKAAGCGEIRPLTPDNIQALQGWHADVTAGLDGSHPDQEWNSKVRAAADELSDMATVTLYRLV